MNKTLASNLGFDARTPLVRRALDAIVAESRGFEEAWVTLETAKKAVNALLSGPTFEKSLYRGLVAEGVLIEDMVLRKEATREVAVRIAYQRLEDHLVARNLLRTHLDPNDPAAAFLPSGGLASICDDEHYVPPGLLEALCIQVPERTGKELPSIVPTGANSWDLGNAFRQSLVWRKLEAFSEDTRSVFNDLCWSEHDFHDTLDVMLTVAMVPEHPFNAMFLDQRLRRDTMPERDSWWSIYVHKAYGGHGAVDRFVDWAAAMAPNTPVDDDAVDLCAIALAWMLSTSNRFLRDRATAALVILLTGRMASAVRLVQRFADVDDPYITERLYAVAYGVAMRSHDAVSVGRLATCVYERVFASQVPAPHILLRDYARGVVERGRYLGAEIAVVPERIRPPYKSTWPTIPSEEDVKCLRPNWSKEDRADREREWARNQIAFSVMDGDFAHYVIGTNGSGRGWLSLGLDEREWKPPPRSEDLLHALREEFSSEELAAWQHFETADERYKKELWSSPSDLLKLFEGYLAPLNRDQADSGAAAREVEGGHSPELVALEASRRKALVALDAVLSEEHGRRLTEILSARENEHEARRPPRFEHALIQRYILWRVFDLGWTTERFGHFDRFFVGYRGREASKVERIGKKYQWIAYHEIMAFISDHYQYCEFFREEEGAHAYEGPWEGYFRDIDPSCTMRSLSGGTSWDGHAVSWWASVPYARWGDPGRPHDWVLDAGDLPNVKDLLVVTDPADGSRWMNCSGFFLWQQQPPVDRESTDVEHREVWYKCTGFLLRAGQAAAFLRWAKRVDLAKVSLPGAASSSNMFLGEHGWAPASHDLQQAYYGHDGWSRPGKGCPVELRAITCEYTREKGDFDCSIDESYTIRLPSADLVRDLGIHWSGHGGDFQDVSGRIAVQDPTVHSEGPSAMLIRNDALQAFLGREKLTICWVVRGEKRVVAPGFGREPVYPWLQMSGAYVLEEGRAVGFVEHEVDERGVGADAAKEQEGP